MKYRRDVDGLRALAVMPVLLFHGGVPGFGGGFVGVDVFFVISGYLITGLILPEIQAGRFSIVTFYERRARRILPALFAVMAFSAVIAYLLFLPGDLRDFSQSLVAMSLFSSNFLFWSQVDYFAAPAEVKPLLHTWSLAVEEQFYIFFPLLLVVACRYLKNRVLAPLLVGGLVVSLLLSIALVAARPTDAFYLPHSRAWELLLGAILVLGVVPAPSKASVGDGLALIGIGLIVASVALYDRAMPFPGLAAVVPCIGTFLVLLANQRCSTAVGRLLGARALVGIGLISYSLYLWHWPMLVFFGYFVARPLQLGEVAVILLLSFAAAALSWKLIETPFRGRESAFRRAHIFTGSLTAGVVLALTGLAGSYVDGLAARPANALLDDRPHPDRERCFESLNPERVRNSELCMLGQGDESRPDFLVWGDSHADALFPAFQAAALASGRSGAFAAESGCPPLLGVTRLERTTRPIDRCLEFNDAVADLLVAEDIRNVFLVARWNVSAFGRTPYELATGNAEVFINDALSTEVSLSENLRTFERGLHRTLNRLASAGLRVWVVLQVPSAEVRVPQYLSARTRGAQASDVRLTLTSGMIQLGEMRERIAAIVSAYGAQIVDPSEVLCSGYDCLIANDGYNVYLDDDHLSPKGALLLRSTFEEILSGI